MVSANICLEAQLITLTFKIFEGKRFPVIILEFEKNGKTLGEYTTISW